MTKLEGDSTTDFARARSGCVRPSPLAQVEQVSLPLLSPFDLKHDVALRREIKSPAGDLDSVRSRCSTLLDEREKEAERNALGQRGKLPSTDFSLLGSGNKEW